MSEKVNLRALDNFEYHQSRQGVLQLICHDPVAGATYLSRAVVLDLGRGHGAPEVLLAARHGVFGQAGPRDCHVRGVDPEAGQIRRVMSAPADATDIGEFDHDWALLETQGGFPASQQRLQAAVVQGQEFGAVSLVQHGPMRPPCQIQLAPAHYRHPDLMIHDCLTRPGMSGSPMVAEIDGVAMVVGLHVGQYVVLEDGSRQGVARRISGELIAYLEDLLR
ncbi:trypsin-like serine peptidase [Maricaulis sp. CAU 1757]